MQSAGFSGRIAAPKNYSNNDMRLIFILATICVLATFAVAQSDHPPKNTDCDYDFDFKFLITHNWVVGKTRDVYVFMDPAAFNDKNLRKLFHYFATKYKSPNIMSVWVETSWYRVPAPNIDCEGNAGSNQPDDPERDKYHWALYIRSGEDEVYRFNPKLGEKSMKTVLLKGKLF